MMERFGYVVGVGIAVSTVCTALYVGHLHGRATAPYPCTNNFHSTTHPWFIDLEQEMLENTEPYADTNGLGTDFENPRELILAVLEGYPESEERRTWVYVNERSGKEFIVPANCVIRRIDFMGDPVLVSRYHPSFF